MNQLTFKLHCKSCNKVYEMPRDEGMTDNTAMACNYCIECEANDLMQDYYDEWFIEPEALPAVVDPNQLNLFL